MLDNLSDDVDRAHTLVHAVTKRTEDLVKKSGECCMFDCCVVFICCSNISIFASSC